MKDTDTSDLRSHPVGEHPGADGVLTVFEKIRESASFRRTRLGALQIEFGAG